MKHTKLLDQMESLSYGSDRQLVTVLIDGILVGYRAETEDTIDSWYLGGNSVGKRVVEAALAGPEVESGLDRDASWCGFWVTRSKVKPKGKVSALFWVHAHDNHTLFGPKSFVCALLPIKDDYAGCVSEIQKHWPNFERLEFCLPKARDWRPENIVDRWA